MNLIHNKLFLNYRVDLVHISASLTKTAKATSEIRIFMYLMRSDLIRITNHGHVTGTDGFAL